MELTDGFETNSLVETYRFDIGRRHGQTHSTATGVEQAKKRAADQLVAQTGATKFRRDADLR